MTAAGKGRALLNPEAGSCEEPGAWRRRLGSAGFDVRVPGSGEETREIARAAAREGVETVVAAGGDGTVHQVANGLLAAGPPAPRLGLVPLGTANDYARSLRLPSDPERALRHLLRGNTRSVDVIEMRREPPDEGAPGEETPDGDAPDGGGEEGGSACVHASQESRSPVYCLNVAVGGFGGRAGRGPQREEKRHWGSLAYLRSALQELGDPPRYRTRIDVDGVPRRDELINVVLANGRFTGGGVPVAPRARLDDGHLRLLLIPRLDLTELRRLAGRLVAGERVDKIALVTDIRSVTIASDPPMHFGADGEQVGGTPLSMGVRPGRLEVIAPDPETGLG